MKTNGRKKWIGLFAILVSITSACNPGSLGLDTQVEEGEAVTGEEAGAAQMTGLEEELLALINEERVTVGLPELARDEGLDQVMLWYGTDMVLNHHIGHEDRNGRFPSERVNDYSDRTDVRCSEITAWWNGADPESHYNAYKNSPGHHAAYMEEGLFNLGPTTHVGIVVLAGTGPEGSHFDGVEGTYSGLVFCDQSVRLEIDPFSE